MTRQPTVRVTADDVSVVGTGMAGLITALSLAPRPVTLITKTPTLESGSSLWAKGGIAAAVGPGDSPEAHAEDTLTAGAGLSDARRALALTREGADIDERWGANPESIPEIGTRGQVIIRRGPSHD